METKKEDLELRMKSHHPGIAVKAGAEALFNCLNVHSCDYNLKQVYDFLGATHFCEAVLLSFEQCRMYTMHPNYLDTIERNYWLNASACLANHHIECGVDATLVIAEQNPEIAIELLAALNYGIYSDEILQFILVRLLEYARVIPELLGPAVCAAESIKKIKDVNYLFSLMQMVTVVPLEDPYPKRNLLKIYEAIIKKGEFTHPEYSVVWRLQNMWLTYGSKSEELIMAYVSRISYENTWEKLAAFREGLVACGRELDSRQRLRIMNRMARLVHDDAQLERFFAMLGKMLEQSGTDNKTLSYLREVLLKIRKRFDMKPEKTNLMIKKLEKKMNMDLSGSLVKSVL